MKSIIDRLQDNLIDDIKVDDDTAIEKHADIIRAEAEAAGYSAEELNKACGGDIGEYIRNRTRQAGGDGEMPSDLSPILTPGFNQQ